MLDYLRYKRVLSRLERERRITAEKFQTEIDTAKSAGAAFQEIARIKASRHHELSMIDAQVEGAITSRLITTALRLELLTPPVVEICHGGVWIHDDLNTGIWYLTREGMAALRKDIRAEREARRQGFVAWSGVGIGVIGALTGLVSVLKGF